MKDTANKTQIVVLGAGFGGLRCALELDKKLTERAQIILVDQHPYHLITPVLYQVATGETPNRAVSIPLKKILEPTKITFVKDQVIAIETVAQRVKLVGQELSYDVLVVALGSRTDFYGIPGLEAKAIPLKTIYDAGWLRLNLRRLFETKPRQLKRIVIGGGGFTGCELVGEIILAVEALSDKYGIPRENIEVAVVEGADQLLPGLPSKVAERVKRRLEWLGVKFYLGRRITSVSHDQVEVSSGEKLGYDLIVWTGGIRACEVDIHGDIQKEKRGNVVVNQSLCCDPSVFVLGDMVFCKDPKTGIPLPGTIPLAIQEGKAVAANIIRLIAGQPLKDYRPKHSGYIIPLTGKYAVAVLELPGHPVFTGRIAFFMFQLVLLRYFLSILPVREAIYYWRIGLQRPQRGYSFRGKGF